MEMIRKPMKLRILKRFGAVEFLADVVGDGRVELRLRSRKLVRNGVRDALWEERRRVELQQALLHHPTH